MSTMTTDTAISLYKKALMIEPGNPEIRQRLMISLLLNGNLEEGVKYANELKNDSVGGARHHNRTWHGRHSPA